jgi:hypothetical protein
MTILDTPTSAPAAEAEAALPASAPRPGPRRDRRRLSDGDGALRLEAQTIKAYRLGDEARRTVGYLRRIVNQRHIPDEARAPSTVSGSPSNGRRADGKTVRGRDIAARLVTVAMDHADGGVPSYPATSGTRESTRPDILAQYVQSLL